MITSRCKEGAETFFVFQICLINKVWTCSRSWVEICLRLDLAWFNRSEGACYRSHSSDTAPLRMAALAAEAAAPVAAPAVRHAAQVNATGPLQHGRGVRGHYVYLIVMLMPRAETVATHRVKTPSDFSRESFIELGVKVHNECGAKLQEVACFQEPHEDGASLEPSCASAPAVPLACRGVWVCRVPPGALSVFLFENSIEMTRVVVG